MIVDVFDRKRSSRCCVCLVAGILSFFPPLQIAASSERPNRKVIHECEWVDSRCVESLAMAVVLLIECFLCIYKKNREREGKVFLSFLAPPPPPPFFSPFFLLCGVVSASSSSSSSPKTTRKKRESLACLCAHSFSFPFFPRSGSILR